MADEPRDQQTTQAQPEPDEARLLRHARGLFQTAKSMGWVDDGGEGPQEFLMRLCYETGLDDAKRAVNGER